MVLPARCSKQLLALGGCCSPDSQPYLGELPPPQTPIWETAAPQTPRFILGSSAPHTPQQDPDDQRNPHTVQSVLDPGKCTSLGFVGHSSSGRGSHVFEIKPENGHGTAV
jgi:hypothetical protein